MKENNNFEPFDITEESVEEIRKKKKEKRKS